MRDQPGQNGTSRKRRRQTIVCTQCRRRKIACDRNTPCTQCVQSKAACTYYNSCSNSSELSSDQDGNAMPSAAQRALATRSQPPPPPASTGPSSLQIEPASTTDAVSEPFPTSLSFDIGASNWLDPAGLGVMALPFNMSIDLDHTGAFSDMTMHALDSTLLGEPQALPAGLHDAKSWVYGPSHWMTLCRKYEQQGLFDDINDAVFSSGGHPILQKCKQLARDLKAKRGSDLVLLSRPLHEFVPSKETANQLVQLHLRTFESVFRVLHVPSFTREYELFWDNPQAASESFLLLLLLVLAIGTCFCEDPRLPNRSSSPTLHEKSTQWIFAVQVRLAAPFRKRNLTVRGVQTQCLLVLALLINTNAIGGDLFWVSTASLVQSAMAIGLHLESTNATLSPFEAEIRRRLWITVLELAVQASLDSGINLVLTAKSALESCELPSNLDDDQFDESTRALPESQPPTCFTQTSIQCALLRSLPVRLKITETLSRFRSELPYDVARHMGAELTAVLRETSDLIDSFNTDHPSPFQVQLQDLLARRFLLVLHGQYAHRASSDVNYYFSRTVCLESSQCLLSTSCKAYGSEDGTTTPPAHDDYANLRLYGDGIFKNVFLTAAITVCAEYLTQLRDDSSPAASSLSRRELLQTIEDAAILTRRRIIAGETSVKAHVFLVCVLAKAGGPKRWIQQRGTTKPEADQVVRDAATRSLDSCHRFLEERLGWGTRGKGPESAVAISNRSDSPISPFGRDRNSHRYGQPRDRSGSSSSLGGNLDAWLDYW